MSLPQVCNYVGMWLCSNFLPWTVIFGTMEVKGKGSAEYLQVLMSKVVEKREGMNYNR